MDRIKIFLTNLGKYNEGILMGEWVKLPVASGELEAVMERIGIGAGYEEYFITDYESSITNLHLSEYTSVSEVNRLAEQLEELNDWDYEKLCAVIEAESPASIQAIQALLTELDGFDLIPEIDDESSLGEFYAEACGVFINLPEIVQRYFDYESYGRDIHLEVNGTFTSYGYVEDRR